MTSQHKCVVIYTRYSTDLQSDKSCEDQERESREGLERMGVDHSGAIVIQDKAISGTKADRPGFLKLQELVDRKQISVLAVDDQSRLTRSDNASSFITDLVFSGGRFIALGENIDTSRDGWQLLVKVGELKGSSMITDTCRRVHRGQKGRVLSGFSAGDTCYGYESFLIDPSRALQSCGPKPERGIRIHEDEATWLRRIFILFAEGQSIAFIVKRLNEKGAPLSNRVKVGRWDRRHVRKILENHKYIGAWKWGATKTIRDSIGRKRQVPVKDTEIVQVNRPELRIIDQVLWERVQHRLEKLQESYGLKPAHKPRGPRTHPRDMYPSSLLQGLIFCAHCDSRMEKVGQAKRPYLACPKRNAKHGGCPMRTYVRLIDAETKVLEEIATFILSDSDWVETVRTEMETQIRNLTIGSREKIEKKEKSLRKLQDKIQRILNLIEQGATESKSLSGRLCKLEDDASKIVCRISELKSLSQRPLALPTLDWFHSQLRRTPDLLRKGGSQAYQALRAIIERIHADQVIPPGKKRGYAMLRFRLQPVRMLDQSLKSDPSQFHSVIGSCGGVDSLTTEVRIELGGPTLMDQWAPRIAQMRTDGVKWTEIAKKTGMDLNRVYVAHRRFVNAVGSRSKEPTPGTPATSSA